LNPARDQALAELLTRSQAGDQAAYEGFLREASGVLRAFLARRMSSASDRVEDVLQETLLSIHRARHSFLPGRPVGPWLYAICEHRMAEFYRRHRRILAVEAPSDLQEIAAVDAAEPESEGLGAAIREALGKLPHKQRWIIERLKLHDLSVKEVAVQSGMSESAVKITAFRGYEGIRKILGIKRK
jgi:RNA polymerase sigma-70 factor (ECF subfamily)